MEIDMKIKRGQILKDLRKDKMLNQAELADFLNVSVQAYQKYEYGTAEPTFDALSKLADFYGVTTDYLLGREQKPPGLLSMNDKELEAALLEAYRNMPEEARKGFLDGVRQAVELNRQSEQGIIEQTTVGAELDRLEAEELDAKAEEGAG